MTRAAVRLGRILGRVGWLAAFVALAGQLALGAVVVPTDATPVLALAAASIFCQSSAATGHDQPPPAHRHATDPAICPLTAAFAQPALILVPEPLLPRPAQAAATRRITVAPARAPPSIEIAAAFPRGPPELS